MNVSYHALSTRYLNSRFLSTLGAMRAQVYSAAETNAHATLAQALSQPAPLTF